MANHWLGMGGPVADSPRARYAEASEDEPYSTVGFTSTPAVRPTTWPISASTSMLGFNCAPRKPTIATASNGLNPDEQRRPSMLAEILEPLQTQLPIPHGVHVRGIAGSTACRVPHLRASK